MPLMKVRNQDNDAWYIVEHLNFEHLGLGISNPIILEQANGTSNNSSVNRLNKIYVRSSTNNNIYEEIMYKTTTEDMVKKALPVVYEISTEMESKQQQNYSNYVNTTNGPKGSSLNRFLIEHRKLTDKNNEIFNIIHYWDITANKWIALNNIWG